jgi:hypothetical protein
MGRACGLGYGVPEFAAGLAWQDDEFLSSRKLQGVSTTVFYTSFLNEVL